MKRILSIMMLILISSVFADELPEYIAQFDKSLAIQLYRDKLQQEGAQSEIYYSLARLYRQTGQTGLAEDCYWHLLQLHNDTPEIYRDYLDFLYNAGSYTEVKSLIKEKHFTQEWGQILLARSYFHEGHFDSSLVMGKTLVSVDGGKLMRLSQKGLDLKLRSPALGGIMSAIIPGSGKVYGGRWMDGMQAFSLVAAPAYNAYYHFRKNGKTSVRGWIWTAATAWFYLSDIYGSVKAVKEYNERQKYKIIEKLDS